MTRPSLATERDAAANARWTVYSLNGTLGEHAAAWDLLSASGRIHHPMLDSRFVDTLLKHFGSGRERLCVLADAGLPSAMCVLRPKGLGVWETFLPSQAQVGAQLLPGPQVVPGLMRGLPGWVQRLELLCVDPAVVDLATTAPQVTECAPHSLTARISLSGSFAAYWARRPKKLRDNMRRYERRLRDAGIEWRHVRIGAADAMGAAIERYGAIESRGWKGVQHTAVAPGNAQASFYAELMSHFAASGQAEVHEIWFGDQLAASRLMLNNGQVLAALKTTYDESMREFAPGRLVMRTMISDAFERHAGKTIEFCTDANQDQLAWMTGQRYVEHWTFFGNGTTAGLFRASRTAVSTLRAHRRRAAADGTGIEIYEHATQLPPDVVQLLTDSERDNVQFGAPWMRNLQDTVFADHEGVRYFVLRREGTPMAVIPTVTHPRRLAMHVSALANYYTALYSPAFRAWLKPADLEPLVREIMKHHAPLCSLRFAPMDPQSAAYKLLLATLTQMGFANYRFFSFGNWYLRAEGDWPAYLAGRDGKIRSTLKRMGQKFAAEGGRLEIISSPADVERGLAAYQAVYAASWKIPEPYPQFIPGLMRMCAEQGWLRLGVAWLGEVPVAAQLWIVANSRAEIYKLAYDEAYKKYSPGTVLTALLFRQAFEADKVHEIDYLIGDDPYKQGWMSHRRERWGIVAYNPRTLSGLAGWIREALGRKIKPWVQCLRTRDEPSPSAVK